MVGHEQLVWSGRLRHERRMTMHSNDPPRRRPDGSALSEPEPGADRAHCWPGHIQAVVTRRRQLRRERKDLPGRAPERLRRHLLAPG